MGSQAVVWAMGCQWNEGDWWRAACPGRSRKREWVCLPVHWALASRSRQRSGGRWWECHQPMARFASALQRSEGRPWGYPRREQGEGSGGQPLQNVLPPWEYPARLGHPPPAPSLRRRSTTRGKKQEARSWVLRFEISSRGLLQKRDQPRRVDPGVEVGLRPPPRRLSHLPA